LGERLPRFSSLVRQNQEEAHLRFVRRVWNKSTLCPCIGFLLSLADFLYLIEAMGTNVFVHCDTNPTSRKLLFSLGVGHFFIVTF
jgi:hypothetical protein